MRCRGSPAARCLRMKSRWKNDPRVTRSCSAARASRATQRSTGTRPAWVPQANYRQQRDQRRMTHSMLPCPHCTAGARIACRQRDRFTVDGEEGPPWVEAVITCDPTHQEPGVQVTGWLPGERDLSAFGRDRAFRLSHVRPTNATWSGDRTDSSKETTPLSASARKPGETVTAPKTTAKILNIDLEFMCIAS